MKRGQNAVLLELPEGCHELFSYNNYEFANMHFDRDFNLYKFNGNTYFKYKLSAKRTYLIRDVKNYGVKISLNQLL